MWRARAPRPEPQPMSRPLNDPIGETRRILSQAEATGVPLRAFGRIAIALRAPTIRRLRPDRTYDGIDLAGLGPIDPIEALLADLGYDAAAPAGAGNGSLPLRFRGRAGRHLEVSLGVLRSSHDLPFGDRLMVDRMTLSLADLLLATLQAVDLSDDDSDDVAALLADHELTDDDAGIGMRRIAAICADDWGWWKTVDDNLRTLVARWRAKSSAAPPVERQILGTAAGRANRLRDRLTSTPKSTTWRLRAVVGERVRWYGARDETA
jgi:hypothetical protein